MLTIVFEDRTADTLGVLAAARGWALPGEYLYELEYGEPAPRRPGTPLFKAPM